MVRRGLFFDLAIVNFSRPVAFLERRIFQELCIGTIAMRVCGAATAPSVPVSRREQSYVIDRTVTALSRMHEEEIVHRDVRPHNLFVRKTGDVVLGDFGLARPMQASFTSLARGTQAFAAPETMPLAAAAASDKRFLVLRKATDVWMLGQLIFFLVTGRCPFMPVGSTVMPWSTPDGADIHKAMLQARRAPAMLDSDWRLASPALWALVMWMLDYREHVRPVMLDVRNHPAFWSVGRLGHATLAVHDKAWYGPADSQAVAALSVLLSDTSDFDVGGASESGVSASSEGVLDYSL